MSQLEKESLGKIMLKSSSLVFFALIITRFFGFLFNSLLTKTITQEEYGIYTFSWSIAQLGVGIMLLGIPPATAYYIAFNRGKGDLEKVKAYTKTGFILVIILVSVSLFGLVLINRLLPNLFSLNRELVMFLLLMFMIHGTGFFFSLVINGYRRPEVATIFAATTPIVSYLSLIILSYLGYGFYPILISIAASLAIQYVLSAAYVVKNWGFGGKFQSKLVKSLVVFGIPLIFMDVSNGLLYSSGIYIIKYYNNFADVGIFWAASMITGAMLIFPQAVISIFSPVVSELFGCGDRKKIEHLSSYIIERLLMFSLPLIAILMLFPEGILKIVFTKDYSSGATLVQILSISTFLTGIYLFFVYIIINSGNPRQNSKIMFVGAVSNVIFNIILVKYYGITGAGFASLISAAIILSISFRWARQNVKIIIYRDRTLKIIVSLALVLPFIYGIKILFTNLILAFILSFVVLITIYFTVLFLLKTFREEDEVMVKTVLGETKFSEFFINKLRKGIS
ncbi:MAG: flippase [Candidatus Methanoperedens sp.]|nr:flippase [Candidatus Methanoperedens sp.]MCZ7371188.1 flippase [Candidatus Methanoperedens sp.]